MGKVLVISYSHTGTSAQLASTLAKLHEWPQAEITDMNPGRGDWRCVFDSLFRRKPPIRYRGPALQRFDAVVLVSPIWMYRLAGPMRSFISQYREHLPPVAVVSVMGGRGAPNAVAEIGHLLGRSPILSTAFVQREVENGSCAARLHAFADAIHQAVDSDEVLRPAVLSPQAA